MPSSLRTIVAACGLLCLVTGAQAQSASTGNVKLYGLIDVSAGRFQGIGGNRIYAVNSGDMTTSYLGFSGNEDLGGGLRARFALEAFNRTDTGTAGRFPGDAFFARNAFVGLSGAFGTTDIGRTTTTLFVSTLLFNAFGDSFTFSPSIRQYFINPLAVSVPGSRSQVIGDTGWNNSLQYASPKYGDFNFNFMINAGEGSASAVGRNVGGNAFYGNGKFGATVAFQQVKNQSGGPLPSGFTKQDTYQLGASYDFTFAKLFAQYGQVRTFSTDAAVDARARISGIGAAVPVPGTLGKVLVQYGYSRTTGNFAPATWKDASVGYDYNLSKNTDIYAVYMHERTTAGLGTITPGFAGSSNSVAGGIRLRF